MLRIQNHLSSFGHVPARRLVFSFVAAMCGFVTSQSAHAQNVTIASPIPGTTVASPIAVRAHNIGCDGMTPTSFAYSIDHGSTLIHGATHNDIDVTNQVISPGTHTIHFKSWTSSTKCPRVDVTFTVSAGTPSGSGGGTPSGSGSGTPSGSGSGTPSGSGSGPSYVPTTATVSANLDTATNWKGEHDLGTPGSSQGSMVFPATTPVYDDAREFYMTYSGHGGHRWHDSFGMNGTATHFALDTYVYFTDPSQVANLELDMNQVTSAGETILYCTQCSTYSKTWEYTYVSGNHPHWRSSNIPCDPKTWTANTWHHIQIAYHRDNNGIVTHDWVDFDGTHNLFQNATDAGGEWLGWAKNDLVVNYQLDGASSSSGAVTSYIHNMQVYAW
jgi:hypothetical protein